MYRVFESLDELVTLVEEARSVPMTSGCVVPRGDVLELLDDVRDALPGELDDAQDVLDKRDQLLAAAREEADQLIAQARAEAQRMVAEARVEAEHAVEAGRRQYDELLARANSDADRANAAGQAAYERAVAEARAEQQRLVSNTEVVKAAHAESARILDDAADEADRLRAECDSYVDTKLADFEELLDRVMRAVTKGRSQLRRPLTAGDNGARGAGRGRLAVH